ASIAREGARLATMARYDEESGQGPVSMPAIMHSIFSRRVVPSFIVDVSEFYRVGSDEPATRISEKGFLDQIEYRMRYFGSLISVEAGEPFFVREALNVEDPIRLLTRS